MTQKAEVWGFSERFFGVEFGEEFGGGGFRRPCRGGCAVLSGLPRVALRFTRGYMPQPRWGWRGCERELVFTPRCSANLRDFREPLEQGVCASRGFVLGVLCVPTPPLPLPSGEGLRRPLAVQAGSLHHRVEW